MITAGQIYHDAALRQTIQILAVWLGDDGPRCQYQRTNGNLPAGRRSKQDARCTIRVAPVEVLAREVRGYKLW